MFKAVKKSISLIIFSVFVFQLISASQDLYHQNVVLFCLKPEVQPLIIEKTQNGITVDDNSINELLESFQIKNLALWLPGATQEDHRGDVYLNRIYRLTIDNNERQSLEFIRDQLANLSVVYSTELDPIRKVSYTPNDPQYNQQWFLSQINANDAWNYWNINGGEIPGDESVILASVDLGVNWKHEDLVGNIWQNLGEDADGDGKTIIYSGGQWIYDPGDLNGLDDDNWDNNLSTHIDDLIGWDVSEGSYGDNNPSHQIPGAGPMGLMWQGYYQRRLIMASGSLPQLLTAVSCLSSVLVMMKIHNILQTVSQALSMPQKQVIIPRVFQLSIAVLVDWDTIPMNRILWTSFVMIITH